MAQGFTSGGGGAPSGAAGGDLAGTYPDPTLALTPLSGVTTGYAALNALQLKGADIASASTTNLATATGQFVHVTGTTTITAFGTAAAGVLRIVTFDGSLTLTHNATSLILQTGANITTAAGDIAVCVSEGSGNWRVYYHRKDGTALAGSGGGTTVERISIEHRAAQNAASGTFTSGAWRTRTITDLVLDETGAASLSSNQLTLPAGDYIVFGMAAVYAVYRHSVRIRNITDSSDVLLGLSQFSYLESVGANIFGYFTLAASKVLEVQHYCDLTGTNTGFGLEVNHQAERYLQFMFLKFS